MPNVWENEKPNWRYISPVSILTVNEERELVEGRRSLNGDMGNPGNGGCWGFAPSATPEGDCGLMTELYDSNAIFRFAATIWISDIISESLGLNILRTA
jgi:hypothetical protein